jgi:hypothetical protein
MPEMIRDGTGRGNLVGVTSENRLMVTAKTESLQHLVSSESGQAYQVLGTTPLVNGRVTVLHIKNISSTLNMVVTYIRHQIISPSGGTTIPNINNYFILTTGRTYVSDGDPKIPVNVNIGSGNLAEVTVYNGAPTLTGAEKEIDRWYTQASGDMNTMNKEGSLIVQPNNTLEMSYIGDQTSGTLYSRMSFIMEKGD